MCRSVEHADVPVTHKDPIHAITYNQNFKQLITSSEGSVCVCDIRRNNNNNNKRSELSAGAAAEVSSHSGRHPVMSLLEFPSPRSRSGYSGRMVKGQMVSLLSLAERQIFVLGCDCNMPTCRVIRR